MKFYRKTRGRAPRIPGQMNKTEARYLEQVLEPRIKSGVYAFARFESLRFKLAGKTFYTPDFYVYNLETGELEIHEVKGGFITEDASIKFKIAAEMFPEFRWLMIQQNRVKDPFEVIKDL